MRHIISLLKRENGIDICFRCGARRDKRRGIVIPDMDNRLYAGAGPITRGWVLPSGKVRSECPGDLLSEVSA